MEQVPFPGASRASSSLIPHFCSSLISFCPHQAAKKSVPVKKIRCLGKLRSHLVNEGGKFVVEGFDLFLLLFPDPLDVGVNLQVERFQKALIDGDFMDAPSWESRATPKGPVSIAKVGWNTKATPVHAPGATTKPCGAIEAATPSSHRDLLAATNVVEAFASKAAPDPGKAAAGVAAAQAGDGAGAEAGPAGVGDHGRSGAEATSPPLNPHGGLARHCWGFLDATARIKEQRCWPGARSRRERREVNLCSARAGESPFMHV